jgi:hypothetical protein
MVGEPVEQGSGKAFGAEDLGPFGEGILFNSFVSIVPQP